MRKIAIPFIMALFIGGCALSSSTTAPGIKKEDVREGTTLFKIFKCKDIACLKAYGCEYLPSRDEHKKGYLLKKFKLKKSSGEIVTDKIVNHLDFVDLFCGVLTGTYGASIAGPSKGDIDKFYDIIAKTGPDGEKIKNIRIYR